VSLGVDGTGWGSCPVAGFGIRGVESSLLNTYKINHNQKYSFICRLHKCYQRCLRFASVQTHARSCVHSQRPVLCPVCDSDILPRNLFRDSRSVSCSLQECDAFCSDKNQRVELYFMRKATDISNNTLFTVVLWLLLRKQHYIKCKYVSGFTLRSTPFGRFAQVRSGI
jgi:hypothetical protein